MALTPPRGTSQFVDPTAVGVTADHNRIGWRQIVDGCDQSRTGIWVAIPGIHRVGGEALLHEQRLAEHHLIRDDVPAGRRCP